MLGYSGRIIKDIFMDLEFWALIIIDYIAIFLHIVIMVTIISLFIKRR